MSEFQLDTLLRDNIKGIKAYSSARDEYVSTGSEMVFLDANENPYNNGVNRYPDPLQRSLKVELSQIKKLHSDQILLGNGSDEVLDLIFRAFCEPGKDQVICFPPTYGMYQVLADLNAIDVLQIPLTKEFLIDTKKVQSQLKNQKLVFVCSPNNPSGNLLQEEAIEELLTNFKGIVVVDEAYIDFTDAPSWIERLDQYPNLIVTQTLSKAYGMAGIRLGMLFASRAIIQVLNKIKPPYNVNELTQKRALERVKDYQKVQEEVKTIIENRTQLISALQTIEYVKTIYPSDANFVLAQVDDASIRYQQLLEAGFVVRNRSTQLHCENTLRFTVGTTQENNQLISCLKSLES